MTRNVPRRALPPDLDAILELERRLYAEDGAIPFVREPAERALRLLLEDRSAGLAWVAECGDQPVGYLLLTWGFSLEFHGFVALVDELFVIPENRSQGLGSALLAAAEQACRARGARAMRLEVERANPRAYDLYRRLGFEPHDRTLMSMPLEDRGPRDAEP